MNGGNVIMIPLEETISTLKNMDIQRYTVVAQFISEINDKKNTRCYF